MEKLLVIFNGSGSQVSAFSSEAVFLSLLLAFVLGQFMAWIYYFTHSGLSYSKSFVQSLILITILVAMIMGIIGNNIITAFGLMGALAIIRFRNVVKDTKDIVFIFSSLIIGMATGTQNYDIAIMGTIFFSFVTLYMYFTDFGKHLPHNGFLRFSLTGHMGSKHPVPTVLKRFCGSFTLISAQDSGFGNPVVEYAYQLMIKNAKKNEKMLDELQNIEGVENISLTMQEQLLEV